MSSADRETRIKKLHERLVKRRNELEGSLQRNTAELGGLGLEGVSGTHPADSASEITEQNKLSAVQQCLRDELAQVYQALAYYERGRYGICECCKREIVIERLEVRPEATMCANCQQAHSRRGSRRR